MASYSRVSDRRRASPRQRAFSLLLALGFEALLVLALLTLAPKLIPPPAEVRQPNVFGISPTPAPQAAPKPERKAEHQKAAQSATQSVRKPTQQPTAAPSPALTLPGIIPMDLSSNDISKVAPHPGDQAPGTSKGEANADSHAVYGPGEGPGGEQLYDVAWYREPTNAELAFYMPPHGAPPGSWAEIACRMIEHYHVENCRALGESPPGSGLAQAMRRAAWQFLVIPPRVGGRSLTGTWVRIRITFDRGPAAS